MKKIKLKMVYSCSNCHGIWDKPGSKAPLKSKCPSCGEFSLGRLGLGKGKIVKSTKLGVTYIDGEH